MMLKNSNLKFGRVKCSFVAYKKKIKPFLLAALSWLIFESVACSQVRNIEIEASMTNNGFGTYSIIGKTNTITIAEGKQIKCLSYFPQLYSQGGSSSSGGTTFSIKALYDGSSKKFTEYFMAAASSAEQKDPVGMVLIGPCVVDLELASNYSYYGGAPGLPSVFIRFEESERFESSGSTSSLIPLASIVVPANATGDVDVLLEQSTDMITWTQCLPGTYNASTQKRFFRVRAVEK